MKIRVISRTRLFPNSNPTASPQHVSLSILDAVVANFAPAAALWIFSKPISPSDLSNSFVKALDSYPYWAGQLSPASYDPQGPHTTRHGRLQISYGYATDPGVEFVVAESTLPFPSFPPNAEQRMKQGHWDADQFLASDLLPSSPSLAGVDEYKGLPALIFQVTSFLNGATAIALQSAHSLADAQCLVQFVHLWASIQRSSPNALPMPVFNPALLDAAAAGDIDSLQPDESLVSIARALPQHRYDWWASRTIDGALDMDQIPPGLDPASVGPPGARMPWSDWDDSAPASHHIFYFSADEVHRMWEAAFDRNGPRVSHQDALLAHVWALVNRARGLEKDDGEVHLNVTIGIRQRLNPSLPETFVGSPIMLTRITSTGAQAAATTLTSMAASIRTVSRLFTSATIPTVLHDLAHAVNPQRTWNAFLGRRNAIVTS